MAEANTYCAHCGSLRDYCESPTYGPTPCCDKCTHATRPSAPAPITPEPVRETEPNAADILGDAMKDSSRWFDGVLRLTRDEVLAIESALAATERENVQRLLDALGVSPTSDEPLMETIIREIGRLKAQ